MTFKKKSKTTKEDMIMDTNPINTLTQAISILTIFTKFHNRPIP